MNIKRISTLLLLMIAFFSLTFAKNSCATNSGNRNYKQFNFTKAALYYEKALKRDKENVYLLQRLADSYRLLNKPSAAEPYYQRLVASGKATPLDKLYYAETLRSAQKYAEAQNYYAQYLVTFPNDSSVKERLRGTNDVAALSTDNGLYQIKNQDSINSKFSEFGVVLHGKNEIYFASDRQPDVYVRRVDNWTNGTFLALYQAEIKDASGNTKNPKLIESNTINKKFHQSSPSYNEKLNELYFDRSNFKGRRARYSEDKTVKLKIYKVAWKTSTEKWNGELEEAVSFNNKEFSACHPSLNKSGDTLYFTSDMPGGYGRSDIYVSSRVDSGSWSAPINLGAGVNSSSDDMFPFIANDGTLYFASNGHSGLGGLDVYSTKKNAGKWSAAKNMGTPINTNADDFGFVVKENNESGYFSSNRIGGAGNDDIYSFTLKGIELKGIAYNGNTSASIASANVTATPEIVPSQLLTDTSGHFTGSAVPNTDYVFTATKAGYYPSKVDFHMANVSGFVRIPMYPIGNIQLEVTVIDKKTRQPLNNSQVKIGNLRISKQETLWTDKDGKCLISVDSITRYRIEASKENYLNASAEVSTSGTYPPATIKQLLELNKTEGAIVLENIYYDLDKWFIRPDAATELDHLVKILTDNPTINIELASHTDCRASANYNKALSLKRAQSAVNYLTMKGINKKRMTAVGYGESWLVNDCHCEGNEAVPCSEGQHQENRRTEFTVEKK